jgi:septum formation protein
MSFILASQSKYRLALLKQIGYVPSAVAPQNVDESTLPRERPNDYIKRVTRLKAQSAFQQHPDQVIISADTIVVLGCRILQKPLDREDARKMLSLFSGRRFRVLTHVCLMHGDKMRERTVTTSCQFKRLSLLEIEKYLDTNEWTHTSGGIAIDELGGVFIKSINGSFSNVMGLPLYETRNLLESFGLYMTWMGQGVSDA